MGNAKKRSPGFLGGVRIQIAIARWLPSAEELGEGIGLTREDSAATVAGKTKQTGTALGKTGFPSTGRRSPRKPITENGTERM
jgi:hypothetical protein